MRVQDWALHSAYPLRLRVRVIGSPAVTRCSTSEAGEGAERSVGRACGY